MTRKQVLVLTVTFLAVAGVFGAGVFFRVTVSQKIERSSSDFIYVDSPMDVNNDHVVDVSDLGIVVSNFGKSGANVRGDVNKDGKVDQVDLDFVRKNLTLLK